MKNTKMSYLHFFARLCIRALGQLFQKCFQFTLTFVHSFVREFASLFVHLFVCSSVRSCVRTAFLEIFFSLPSLLIVCLFVRSLVRFFLSILKICCKIPFFSQLIRSLVRSFAFQENSTKNFFTFSTRPFAVSNEKLWVFARSLVR